MFEVQSGKIKSFISMAEAIDCLEKGFSDYYKDHFVMPQRSLMEVNGTTVLTMPSHRKNGKYFIVKVVTIFDNSSSKREKMINSSILVFKANSGNLIASLDGDPITAIRTGAASGVATKYFSSEDSHSLAIFGTGAQAYTQAEAVLCVRPINKVFVFGRNLTPSKKFSEYISDFFSVDVELGEEKNLKDIDIICTATPSKEPLFNLQSIKNTTHINAIGSFKSDMIEIHHDIINESKVIVDSLAACKKEAGDLIQANEQTNWDFNNVSFELGKVSKAKLDLDEFHSKRTVFKSVGLGFQDLVIAEFLMEKFKN